MNFVNPANASILYYLQNFMNVGMTILNYVTE